MPYSVFISSNLLSCFTLPFFYLPFFQLSVFLSLAFLLHCFLFSSLYLLLLLCLAITYLFSLLPIFLLLLILAFFLFMPSYSSSYHSLLCFTPAFLSLHNQYQIFLDVIFFQLFSPSLLPLPFYYFSSTFSLLPPTCSSFSTSSLCPSWRPTTPLACLGVVAFTNPFLMTLLSR